MGGASAWVGQAQADVKALKAEGGLNMTPILQQYIMKPFVEVLFSLLLLLGEVRLNDQLQSSNSSLCSAGDQVVS